MRCEIIITNHSEKGSKKELTYQFYHFSIHSTSSPTANHGQPRKESDMQDKSNQQAQPSSRVLAFNQGVITAHLATALLAANQSISTGQAIPKSQVPQIKNALTDYRNYCAANGLNFSESIEQ
jgi:hypothetical protein